MIRTFAGPVLAIAGVVAIVAGAVGLMLRPAGVAEATAPLETSVLVIPPSVVALDGLEAITVTAPGEIDVRTARPGDAYAWAAGVSTSVVRGLTSWEQVDVEDVYSSSGAVPDFAGDLWRTWTTHAGTTVFDVSTVEPGVAIVVIATGSAPLSDVSMTVTRERGNGWAWPLVAGGLAGVAVGLVFFASDTLARRPKWWKGNPAAPVAVAEAPESVAKRRSTASKAAAR